MSMPQKKVKTYLVGNAGDGKEDLIHYLSDLIYPGSYNPFIVCSSPHGDITFDVQNTPGQEKYRDHVKVYITNAQCVIFLFDVASKESFDDLDMYFEQVRSGTRPECVFVLVGNVQDKTKERQVEKDIALDYSQKIEAIQYIEISTSTGENIKEMFQYIADYPDLQYEEDLSDKYISVLPTENSDKKNNKCF